jgi:hexosaminidase
MQVIPLVQTFGHLEFVLKNECRRSLREVEKFPNCIVAVDARRCNDDDAFKLLTSMIDDFVSLTPDCPAVHLGGDEVWHLGVNK